MAPYPKLKSIGSIRGPSFLKILQVQVLPEGHSEFQAQLQGTRGWLRGREEGFGVTAVERILPEALVGWIPKPPKDLLFRILEPLRTIEGPTIWVLGGLGIGAPCTGDVSN